jgi:hypothetical protein
MRTQFLRKDFTMDRFPSNYAQGFSYLARFSKWERPLPEEAGAVVLDGHGVVAVEDILDHFERSEAVLPRAQAALLGLPLGSTYAAGVQEIRAGYSEVRARRKEFERLLEADLQQTTERERQVSPMATDGKRPPRVRETGENALPPSPPLAEPEPSVTLYPDYVPDQEDLRSLAWSYLDRGVTAAEFGFFHGQCEIREEIRNLDRFEAVVTVLREGGRRKILDEYDKDRRVRDDGSWELFKYANPGPWPTPADPEAARRFAMSIPSEEAMTEDDKATYGPEFLQAVKALREGEGRPAEK